MTPGARPALAALTACVLLQGRWVAAQVAPAPAPRAAAPAAGGPSFDQLAKKAAAAREAGQLDDAIRYYGQALAMRPAWMEGHWALGTLLYDIDRYSEARDHFRRVVQAEPKNGVALALKGLCEAQLKNYERALGRSCVSSPSRRRTARASSRPSASASCGCRTCLQKPPPRSGR